VSGPHRDGDAPRVSSPEMHSISFSILCGPHLTSEKRQLCILGHVREILEAIGRQFYSQFIANVSDGLGALVLQRNFPAICQEKYDTSPNWFQEHVQDLATGRSMRCQAKDGQAQSADGISPDCYICLPNIIINGGYLVSSCCIFLSREIIVDNRHTLSRLFNIGTVTDIQMPHTIDWRKGGDDHQIQDMATEIDNFLKCRIEFPIV
jgi:hypothetical protein